MSSAEVHCVSTTKVRPASYIDKSSENNRRIDLNPWDLSFLKTPYMQRAGRLGIEKHENDKKISVYINCNSEGAEFVHATAGVSIEDIVSPIYTPQSIIDSFFTFNGVLNYEGQSHPLLSIQVTELLDGVFIGLSYIVRYLYSISPSRFRALVYQGHRLPYSSSSLFG
ncbi:hypothetical protein MKW94_013537 [Papaver nudicaule]|uniref:Uncharacterized protein n=1 Tax=Papaver nudicaule TaxID=74823 RepID=A0AA41V9Z5_PAPNU|nr:hypothetical protein [Papaver nudicaule]